MEKAKITAPHMSPLNDAVMLSIAEEDTSSEERVYLYDLVVRVQLPIATVNSITLWVQAYGTLLEQLGALVTEPA